MKISNIQPIKNFISNKNFKNKQTVNQTNYKNINNLNFYPAFLGGYSLDLSKVNENLKEEYYPPDIFEAIQKTLKENNPQNKSLYDIHFEKYKGVLDCFSLDELKEKYPEFKNVNSVFDIETQKDSFIGQYLEGKSDVFSNEEDLTLQLIKLYWGQGFSLNDLTKYLNENSKNNKDFNLYYTMAKKLNIPLMNSHYAHVLKLSNKKYNDNFRERISIKIKEAKEAKKQKEEGEPIVIPRGPLSNAHKKHISESLKKYYIEHPEAIYKQSKRQSDFISENPEFKDEMSEAMVYAWNKTQEGLSVKKYLSKFMKKCGGISEEELALKITIPKEKISALELFWIKNPWAREKFSTAVSKGWDYVKNLSPKNYFGVTNNENCIILNLVPTKINKKIATWAKENGLFIDECIHYGRVTFNKNRDYTDDKKAQEYKEKIDKTVLKYDKEHPREADICASVLQFTLIDFENDLEKRSEELPEFVRNNPEIIKIFKDSLSFFFNITPVYEKIGNFNKFPINGLEYNDLKDYFLSLVALLYNLPEGYKVADYINHKIDRIYELLETGNQNELNKIISV